MQNNQDSKRYDLEERTLKFAQRVRSFVKKLPKTLSNIEDSKQLISIFDIRISDNLLF